MNPMMKDSFDAATGINRILPQVHENDEYIFVSLDVVSLFANVPLKKIINIIIKYICNKNDIAASLPSVCLKS